MGNGASENEDDPNAYQLDREPDPSDSLRTFGAFVQAMREHAGYSRTEFGALVGYSKYTVESVEYGRRMPDRSFVEGADSATGPADVRVPGGAGAPPDRGVREGGLRGRRFGTTEQMRELFDHVLELTALRNVTLQIMRSP